MFQTPFDYIVSIPFTNWATMERLEFIISLQGAIWSGLVIAGSTWILDTKRKLNSAICVRIERLEQALQDAKPLFSRTC
jgi:hypothetical protein